MIKNYVNLFLVMALLMFSGCVSVSNQIEILEDGLAKNSFSLDFSVLNGFGNAVNNLSQPKEDLFGETFCEEYNFSKVERFSKNFSCKYDFDRSIGTIFFDSNLIEEGNLNIEKTLFKKTYTLKLNTSFDTGLLFPDESIEKEQMEFEMFAFYGASCEYNVIIPGEIISTNFGDIQGNEISFNCLDNNLPENLVVISEKKGFNLFAKYNFLELFLIFSGIILILLFLGLFLKHIKK